MLLIEPVTAASDRAKIEGTRRLFRDYGVFLRGTGDHNGFRYDRFEAEVLTLPAAYADYGGEVLVAVVDSAVAACIAYRALAGDEECCEVKRLYVDPEYRTRGLGEMLIIAALQRAGARGYQSAYLDTEPDTMPAAHRTYLKLGFAEYDRRDSPTGATVYLRKRLP